MSDTFGPEPNDDAAAAIIPPYRVSFTLEGTSNMLFHRWSNEAVAAQASAAKGSAAKKSDSVDVFVYRDDREYICIPGEYVRMSMVNAAKFKQDPRSSRKSAMDLYKAALISLTELARITPDGMKGPTKKWDFVDQRRVTIQRSAITRSRPGFYDGWRATFEFEVGLPEYISPKDFQEVLALAGRTVGLGDFRPSHGRFSIVNFKRL